MRISRVVSATIVALLLNACGEEGKPVPGTSDPCTTPMAGVLDCPADSQLTSVEQSTILDVCEKLVSCGILASDYLGARGQACSNAGDCPGGQCFKQSEDSPEMHCHYPHLDYQWCISRLSSFRHDPCNSEQRFSQQQIESTIECIARTPCGALGLPFDVKLSSHEHRPELDRYSCKDSEKIWTATICDHGLLQY